MRFVLFLLLLSSVLPAGFVAGQGVGLPPGAYRTAATYRQRRPQPAGTDAFFPDKRGQVVVVVPRGAGRVKLRVAPDSVWGIVSEKGRTTRLYRGAEYRLEFADTLCVYSSNAQPTANHVGGPLADTRYYFSRGLTGLIFPLTARYLREAYEASNPGFVAELAKLRFDQSPADFDRKTGLFRVTVLYRNAAEH